MAGLTPGHYRIQAALDNIWLSSSAPLDVSDRSINDLMVLTIPPPGGAVVVRVFRADGKPKFGQSVTIDRPAGPLAGLLWPKEWITDGAGETRIPALEAGKHTLRLKESAVTAEVVVPALPVEHAVAVQMHVPPVGGR